MILLFWKSQRYTGLFAIAIIASPTPTLKLFVTRRMLLENPKASVPKAVPSLFRKQSYFWSTFRTATFLHFLELRLDMGHSLGNRNILLLFAGKFSIQEDLPEKSQAKQKQEKPQKNNIIFSTAKDLLASSAN